MTMSTVTAAPGRRRPLMRFAALSTVLILLGLCCSVSYAASPAKKKKPSRAEKKVLKKEQLQKAKAQVAKFEQMKKEGADMISNTKEAAALRSYELRKKKTRGIIRKREKPISSILFPGMAPEEYNKNELVPINVELVRAARRRSRTSSTTCRSASPRRRPPSARSGRTSAPASRGTSPRPRRTRSASGRTSPVRPFARSASAAGSSGGSASSSSGSTASTSTWTSSPSS